MRKKQLKVVPENQDIDMQKFLIALQVPEIQKIIYHLFEELKEKYQEEIARLDQVEEIKEGDNILPLNRAEYFPLTTPEKLKIFFKTVLANPILQKIVLDDFESVYVPMMGLKEKIS